MHAELIISKLAYFHLQKLRRWYVRRIMGWFFVDNLRTVINGSDGPLPRKRCKTNKLSHRPSTHTIPQSITRTRLLIVSRVGKTGVVYLSWFIADLCKVIQTFKELVLTDQNSHAILF